MSKAEAHTGHGHAGDTAHGDHPEGYFAHTHVSSIGFYVGILAALMVLTLLTVGIASIHLGKLNLAVAVVIASMKATLVVTFFMHLKYDNRFNATMFICSLLFIGIFFAYTLNDTDTRAQLDDAQGSQVLPQSGLVAPGGMGGNISPERSHENLILPEPEDIHNPLQQQQPVVNRSALEQPGMAAGGLGGTGAVHEEHGAEGSPALEHKEAEPTK